MLGIRFQLHLFAWLGTLIRQDNRRRDALRSLANIASKGVPRLFS
jgi:hypothetical protein